jgi:hypothetical protein
MAVAAPPDVLWGEITDFLVSSPTLEEIVAFRPSDVANQRLHELLELAGESKLSVAEHHELDEFLRISHVLNLLAGKARLKLVGKA